MQLPDERYDKPVAKRCYKPEIKAVLDYIQMACFGYYGDELLERNPDFHLNMIRRLWIFHPHIFNEYEAGEWLELLNEYELFDSTLNRPDADLKLKALIEVLTHKQNLCGIMLSFDLPLNIQQLIMAYLIEHTHLEIKKIIKAEVSDREIHGFFQAQGIKHPAALDPDIGKRMSSTC